MPTTRPKDFTVDAGQFQGVPVVNLRGFFRGREAYLWAQEEFRKILDGGATTVVIHLGGVEKIDSGAMGTLAEVAVSLRRKGGTAKLAAVPDKILHLFKITKLVTLFEVFPDTKSATASGI